MVAQRLEMALDPLTRGLVGCVAGGHARALALVDDAREMVSDIVEISDMSHDVEESEVGETDYAEVVEYVRTGTMLLYMEMRSGSGGAHRSIE